MPRSIRILFIDDEGPMLRWYQRKFGPTDAVTLADDGTKAVEILETGGEFDLVVCDLSMPGLTGADVYAWVQTHRPELARKFVFATGSANDPLMATFLAPLPNRVLEKPFDLSALVAIVERARGDS